MIRIYATLLILFIAASFAETPIFETPLPIQANGVNINVGYGGNASPFMIDWDGDGKQDLLLGQFDQGRIRFYTNTGTNYNPTFGNFVYLQAGGSYISLSSG
ncbi:MAG: hypothetical protein PVI51_03775 [candidate division WOR-3 bacterium]|jgi:hypothetical protein